MGLIFHFPTDLTDLERTERRINPISQKEEIILKTYGLPMIFWGYLVALLTVLGAMALAAKAPLLKLISYPDDPVLRALGHLVAVTLILLPLVLIAFFFYEKHLKKSENILTIIHKLFFLPIIEIKIPLDKGDSLKVEHYLDSPNMAKLKNQSETKGFENKGYFELYALSNGKKILVDRHSRKADLLKLKELLKTTS